MFSLFRLNCVKSTLSLSIPRRLVGRSHILYAARWRAARCCLQRQLRRALRAANKQSTFRSCAALVKTFLAFLPPVQRSSVCVNCTLLRRRLRLQFQPLLAAADAGWRATLARRRVNPTTATRPIILGESARLLRNGVARERWKHS